MSSRGFRYEPKIEGKRRTTWRDRAVCADAEPELFYPDPSDHDAANAVINDYCDVCPVKAECLAQALAEPAGQQWGIQGGTTQGERVSMLRRAQCRRARDRAGAA